ncbi:MAG: M66 family metalloprotease [Polyangiales bacterium]
MTRSSVLLPRPAPSRSARATAIWLALALALSTGCAGDVYGGAERDEVDRALAIVPACRGARAHDARVEAVALYQAVKIPLYADGAWLEEREVPIIAGKKALVRVFVRPDAGWTPRKLRAVLRLRHGDHVARREDARVLRDAPTDADLASTFNFDVAPDLITPDARVSVALEEADCPLSPADEKRAGDAVVEPLRAEERGTLRVVLVPMRVGTRVPVLTESTVTHITDALRAFFPVPDVEVRVDQVIDGEPVVGPGQQDASQWRAMLDRVHAHRGFRAPEPDVYYVGVFQPAPTRAAYCAGGCTLGNAHQTSPSMVSRRHAVVAFFGDEMTGESVAHELGHAHGLGHAPCAGGAKMVGQDPDYPDELGRIGEWGWDTRTSALIAPAARDFMSYCGPYGISAYHYGKLAARTRVIDRVPRAP